MLILKTKKSFTRLEELNPLLKVVMNLKLQLKNEASALTEFKVRVLLHNALKKPLNLHKFIKVKHGIKGLSLEK